MSEANIIDVHIGSQDTLVLQAIGEVLKNLNPKYRSRMYDSSGTFVREDDKGFGFNIKQTASGGSFGLKLLWGYQAKLEVAIFACMYTKKSIRYVDYWRTSEQIVQGRYNGHMNTHMKISTTDKKITHLAKDLYTSMNINSHLGPVAGLEIMGCSNRALSFDNMASRVTLMNLNIGETMPTRGYGQPEGVAFGQALISKASALISGQLSTQQVPDTCPQYELLLNHITYVNDRTNSALVNGFTDVGGGTMVPNGFLPTGVPLTGGGFFQANPGFPTESRLLLEKQ